MAYCNNFYKKKKNNDLIQTYIKVYLIGKLQLLK